MKQFLTRTIIFVCVIIVALLLLLLPLKPQWMEGRKKIYVERQQKKFDVFILGSSRAEHGVNPRLFDSAKYNVFNMGEDGQGLPSNYLMLKMLVEKYHVNISNLLYEVDEMAMAGEFVVKFRDDFFISDIGDDEVYTAFQRYRGKPFAWVMRHFPQAGNLVYTDFYKFVKRYPLVLKKQIPAIRRRHDENINIFSKTRGYDSLYTTPDPTTKSFAYSMNGDDKAYLEKIIAFCRQHHIKLYFFRTPVLDCQKINGKEFDEYIHRLCLQENIPFYDFKCDYQLRDLYKDQKHPADSIASLVTYRLIDSLHFR